MSIDKAVVPEVKQERAQATVTLLVNATIEALEAHGESGLRLDDILEATGVSRSSLYHHFGDRDGLVDAARVVMFTRTVESDLVDLQQIMEHATDPSVFRAAIEDIHTAAHSPDRQPARLRRAYTIGATKARPSLAAALAEEQHRLTNGYTELVEAAQSRGWLRNDVDARAVAVLLQATALGRVVSDIDTTPVDPDAWHHLVGMVLRTSLLTDEGHSASDTNGWADSAVGEGGGHPQG